MKTEQSREAWNEGRRVDGSHRSGPKTFGPSGCAFRTLTLSAILPCSTSQSRSRGHMSAAVIFRDFSATRSHFPSVSSFIGLPAAVARKSHSLSTRQLRSCVVALPQDVEREGFEWNSASDPWTALLHQHVGPDAVDIKIGKVEVTAFGRGDAGAQKGCNNGCVAERFEVCVRPRYAGLISQATIIVKRKVDRCGFVLGPRFLPEHLSRRVSRAKFHGDQMSNEPIDELQIPQPCRCARCSVSREFLKKSVDVIRSERRQSLATGEKESIEACKHRAVLNDGSFGESSAVGASGFGALPLRICCFGIARPECQCHKSIY